MSGQLELFVDVVVVVIVDEVVVLVAVEELDDEVLLEELDEEVVVEELDVDLVLLEELDVGVVVVVLCVVLVEVVDDTSATWKVPVHVLVAQTVVVPPFVGKDQHAPPSSKQMPKKFSIVHWA
jgi:hypothetical protein